MGTGNPCPVCEANTALWNTGLEENKEIVRRRKRSLKYISNIIVLSDAKHPENEGKVFLFTYGTKIFAKMMNAINPEFEDEKSFDPFNFWGGAPFKLKIRNVEGYRNYDKSEFGECGPLFEDDDAMDFITAPGATFDDLAVAFAISTISVDDWPIESDIAVNVLSSLTALEASPVNAASLVIFLIASLDTTAKVP